MSILDKGYFKWRIGRRASSYLVYGVYPRMEVACIDDDVRICWLRLSKMFEMASLHFLAIYSVATHLLIKRQN